MSNTRLFVAPIALAAAALFLAPAESLAYGWGGYYGIGGLYRSLDYPTERRVPYFAAHPPVYYSMPIPRTYGHSPFAYPPGARTPDFMSTNKAVEIINPYVESSSKATKKSKKSSDQTISNKSELKVTAPGPLTIENPYVNQEKKPSYH